MVPVSSTSVHSSASHLQTTSPVPQKQENQTENQLKRPQSVFVLPITSRENNNFQQQDPQLTMIPAIKKRRAPAPPAPPNSQTVVSAPTPPTVVSAPTPPRNPQTVGSLPTSPLSVNTHSNDHVKTSSAENVQNEICENTQTVHNKKTALTRQTASDLEEVSASAGAPQQQVTRLDMLSYIHSRNSSDSSGYHELTLSGCESPEATHVSHTNYKTSIDTTSVDSSDNANGDSAILESPVRVSPIVELPEKSDTDLMSGLTIISIDSLPPRKTRKAPAPPRVQSSPAQVPAESLAPIVREAWGSATASELPIESVADTGGENKLETRSPRDGDQVGEIAALGSSDVLDRAVSNSQLQSMEFVFITKSEHEDGDSTMMMETASVCSENIEQVDISSHGNHACSLILPPPPLDPSSGDETVESPYSQADNVSVDKDKDIAEGIRSVAPSSAVHSQGHARKNSHVSLGSVDTVEGISLDFQQTIQLGEEAFSLPSEDMEASFGYKSEMALFVERMRTLAVEKAEEEKHEPLDDSGSSLSVPCSDSNYDSESVIQHHHMDSSSETGSLTRREGGWLQLLHLQSNLDGCHEDVSEQVAEQPIMCEESVEHAATLRPPPEFVDRDDNSTDDRTFRPTDEKTDSSIDKRTCKKDNENTFTEIVQENCNLVDFTSTEHVAATTIKVKQTSANNDMFMDNKVKNSGTSVNSDTLTDNKVKDTMTLSNNDMENKVNASGTLLVNSHTFTDHTLMNRETLVNVDTFTDCTGPPTSMFGHGNNSQPKLVELQAQTTPVRKEEIILTTEDLSNVTFLPPKSKRAKPIHIQPYVQTQPYIRPLSASLIMAKSGRLTAGNDIKSNMSATEDVQSRVSSRLLLSQGPDTTVNEQSQTAHDLPLTQPFMHASEIHTDSNDDVSDDPLISKSRPRLLMNSSNNPSRKSTLGQLQVDGNNKKVANRHSSSYQISKTSSIVTNEIDQQIGKSIVAPRQNTQKISSTDVAASTTAAGGERVNDQISRSSDDKISEELRRKRRHLNSTRSGSASVSTNESLSSAPPARDQMSRESAEGKQTAPLATDQMSRESAVGKQTAPPATDQRSRESAVGKQTAPLATDQMSRESAVGKQTAPPATDQIRRESAVGKQTAPPATDQIRRESAVGKQTAPPATDQRSRESAVGKQTAPPATDQRSRESAVGKQTAPPATDQRSRESAVGKQTAPPAKDQMSRESAVGKQTAPLATDQIRRESAVGKQTAPPATDQIRRESAVGKQRSKSTPQPQLDLHEQLMAAVRMFSRDAMKSVSHLFHELHLYYFHCL
ncbi:hypothetical protein BsWGS_00001 [Bradybaena similaris]